MERIVGGYFQRLKAFLVEVWAELQKTTWPAQREVYGTTVVVIVAVLITALYLYVVDKVLETGMQFLFRTAGR